MERKAWQRGTAQIMAGEDTVEADMLVTFSSPAFIPSGTPAYGMVPSNIWARSSLN